jgi:hypothetical protein
MGSERNCEILNGLAVSRTERIEVRVSRHASEKRVVHVRKNTWGSLLDVCTFGCSGRIGAETRYPSAFLLSINRRAHTYTRLELLFVGVDTHILIGLVTDISWRRGSIWNIEHQIAIQMHPNRASARKLKRRTRRKKNFTLDGRFIHLKKRVRQCLYPCSNKMRLWDQSDQIESFARSTRRCSTRCEKDSDDNPDNHQDWYDDCHATKELPSITSSVALQDLRDREKNLSAGHIETLFRTTYKARGFQQTTPMKKTSTYG